MDGPVLITGGHGMIGTAVVAALSEHGVAVLAPQRREVDLLQPNEASALIERTRPSALVHCAWDLRPESLTDAPSQEAWVEASVELLEAFGRAGGRHATVIGTCAEYAWDADRLVEGRTSLRPSSVYGRAKHALHVRSTQLAEAQGWRLGWLRVFWVFGPREQPGRLVPSVISALLAQERARCTDGHQKRDYLYSGDVGRAVAELARMEFTGAVNIASGRAVAVRDIVAAIASEIGRPDLIDWGALPPRTNEPETLVGDSGRLISALPDWAPLAIGEGVSQTVAWWRSSAHAAGARSANRL